MSLYNIINNTNKYVPYYILPEPTIMFLHNNKPIQKSIQKNKLDLKTYLNRISTDDINTNDNNNNVYEIVYIRIKRNYTNTGSEWKKIIQKS